MSKRSIRRKSNDTSEELIERALRNMEKEKTISVFDLVPEYSWLLEKTYCSWVPPGSPQILEKHPSTNIVALILSSFEHILVPIQPIQLSDFKNWYGISWDNFLELVKKGTLCPHLVRSPKFYPSYFKALYKAYQDAPYENKSRFPPFIGYRLTEFIGRTSIQFKFRKCEQDASVLFNRIDGPDSLVKLSKEFRETEEGIRAMFASSLWSMRCFGFEDLCKTYLELDPNFAFRAVLMGHSYLIENVTGALCGFSIYDDRDLRNMAFLRLPKPELLPSPLLQNFLLDRQMKAAYPIGSSPTIIVKIEKYQERHENELKTVRNDMIEFRNSVGMTFNIERARATASEIAEDIEKIYSDELKEYFKLERLSNIMKRLGFGVAYAPRAIMSSTVIKTILDYNFDPLLRTVLFLSSLLGLERLDWLVDELNKTDPHQLAELLFKKMPMSSRWLFKEKGLPYFLWLSRTN
jgi:hypothetical protein